MIDTHVRLTLREQRPAEQIRIVAALEALQRQLPLRLVRGNLALVRLPYGVVELSADAILEAARHEVLGQQVEAMHRRIEHEDIVEGPTGLGVHHAVPMKWRSGSSRARIGHFTRR